MTRFPLTHGKTVRHMDSMAEDVMIEVESTGYQGGDAGHGGRLKITITPSEGLTISPSVDENGREPITLEAAGDWEMEALARAMLLIAEMLLHQAKEEPKGIPVEKPA